MVPVALIQRLAAVTPAYAATAVVLIGGALITLLCAVVRDRRGVPRVLPGIVFVIAATASLWPLSRAGTPPSAVWAALLLAGAALAAHFLLGRTDMPDDAAAVPASPRASLVYLIAAGVLAGIILLDNLGGYAGWLVNWESPVTNGFGDAFVAGQGVLKYTAQRFLWDNGLLSAGHTSLFYGAPTYALFHLIGFSTWTLRISAVLATLLSVAVVYAFGRRFFNPPIGAAMALALGLNICVLFYGRYGSSPAGTMLGLLLALYATWAFLDRDQSAWWMGAVCAAALFAATLQYAPARLMVIVLVGYVMAHAVYHWRRLGWRRAVGLLTIIGAAAGVWEFEHFYHVDSLFLHARGEQFFEFLQAPDQIQALFGKQMIGRHIAPNELTWVDKLTLLIRVLQTTVPQYLGLIMPSLTTPALGAVIEYDPPPLQLYYAPVAVFIVWGLMHSIVRIRSWRHNCLLALVVISSAPLLMTNRVDSHRGMLLTVPVSMWAAFGIWEAIRLMRQAKVPAVVQHVLAAALVSTVVCNDVNILNYDHIPQSTSVPVVVGEVESAPGPVALGAMWNHREVSMVQLGMLERMWRNRDHVGMLLPEGIVHNAADEGTNADFATRELLRMIQHEHFTVLLAPAENFRKLGMLLQQRGVRVAERGTSQFRVMRMDAGAGATGVPDTQVKPLPTIALQPTPTPFTLESGPQISLSTLQPTDVTYGFMPPKIDHAFTDGPLVMGGVTYTHGIGMHAWCRMTYAVPKGAIRFQAIIGLSDFVRDCAAALVTFEVRDDKDAVLFESGPVDGTTPPRAIRVDLHGAKAITLVVTEGGNGRDCDHANWAETAFLLKR